MKPTYVYYLEAEGVTLMGFQHHTLRSSTCFTTHEKAAQRIGNFRALAIDPEIIMAMTDDESLKIRVVPMEVVE